MGVRSPALMMRVGGRLLSNSSTRWSTRSRRTEYLQACLLEVCRLFPPVTRTFVAARDQDVFEGRRVPAGICALMNYGRVRTRCDALSQDPMPRSFPDCGFRYETDTNEFTSEEKS